MTATTATSARLLRLLAVLSSRPSWTNAELAERLDDDEALAVFAALRNTTGQGILGNDQAAMSALLKLRHLLPTRIVERLDALDDSSVDIVPAERDQVAVPLLFEIATACRSGERLRLSYRDARGQETRREVDPHQLVRSPNRWYLVAFDVAKGEWRTFRADRIVAAHATGRPVELDDRPDAAAMVTKMLVSDYPYYAVVRVAVPLAEARRLVPPNQGAHQADGPDATVITIGGVTPESLAAALFRLPTPLLLDAPDEVRDAVRRRAEQFIDAAGRAGRDLRG